MLTQKQAVFATVPHYFYMISVMMADLNIQTQKSHNNNRHETNSKPDYTLIH